MSKGPKTFPMPNVLLQKVNQAKAYLEGLGLIVDTVVTGNGDHIVVGQVPGQGHDGPRGRARHPVHPVSSAPSSRFVTSG